MRYIILLMLSISGGSAERTSQAIVNTKITGLLGVPIFQMMIVGGEIVEFKGAPDQWIKIFKINEVELPEYGLIRLRDDQKTKSALQAGQHVVLLGYESLVISPGGSLESIGDGVLKIKSKYNIISGAFPTMRANVSDHNTTAWFCMRAVLSPNSR